MFRSISFKIGLNSKYNYRWVGIKNSKSRISLFVLHLQLELLIKLDWKSCSLYLHMSTYRHRARTHIRFELYFKSSRLIASFGSTANFIDPINWIRFVGTQIKEQIFQCGKTIFFPP